MMKQLLTAIALTATAALPAMAQDARALAQSKNCMACHAVDKLADKVVKGGGGVWGPVPMPANPQVSAAEAKTLTTWILSLK